MNRKNKPTIWMWEETENPFGRALGLITALVSTFSGTSCIFWMPVNWLGSTPFYLIFGVFTKLFGICALIYGIGVFHDLWITCR